MAEAVLQGEIAAFRLPDVLTLLSNSRKSGTLAVQNGDRKTSLFFEDGALVYAGSNQESLRLASVLVRKRKITAEQRERLDELMLREGGRRFGELAVQENVLTEDQLRDFLKIQVSEIVYDAFVWNGGTFQFLRDSTLPPYAVTITIDLPNLIMEGARRIEEWEQCLRLLPDSSVVFRVVTSPRDEKITLTSDEWKLLFLINGQRTLKDLCEDAEEPLNVYRVVYGLYANKLIEEVRPVPREEETGTGDATMRQGEPQFGKDPTVQDEPASTDDTSLLVSTEARMSYSDVVSPTLAQLRIDSGENAGQIIPLAEPEYLIGRHRDNGIHIQDLGVSGFHARIYRGPEGYVLEDLKSRNGTWVNGSRIYHATLANGDRVHVGQTDLIYEVLYTDAATEASQ